MKVGATEVFGGDLFTCRRFNQGWTSQENRALIAYDNALVRHRRNVGTTRGTRTHYGGNSASDHTASDNIVTNAQHHSIGCSD